MAVHLKDVKNGNKKKARKIMQINPWVARIKRLFDVLIGLFGCGIFAILFPILWVLIRIESPGAVIYKQARIGINRRSTNRSARLKNHSERRNEDWGGSPFTIYKIRTMRSDAEKMGPQLWSRGGDSRVTRVGRILRALHLDELPQFYNVLKGDMSFIGPRPERSHYTKQYIDSIPHYARRTLGIKPGLTGLSQILLGYDDTFESVVRKTQGDFSYRMSMASLGTWIKMEIWLLWRTCFYVLHISALLAKKETFDGNSSMKELSFPLQTPPQNYSSPVWVNTDRAGSALLLRGKSPSEICEKLRSIHFDGSKYLQVCLDTENRTLGLVDIADLIPLLDQVRSLGGKVVLRDPGANAVKILREYGFDKTVDVRCEQLEVKNFLTIDVECWFQANNMREVAPHSTWHQLDTRIEENIERLLNILEAHQTKATFFVLGWIADHFPDVVRAIDKAGHQVGIRGYYHYRVTDMTPVEFTDDFAKALEAVQKLCSHPITTSRAANFSIGPETLWALEIMDRFGINTDSSIYPIYKDGTGYPGYPLRTTHSIILDNGNKITEVPLSVASWGNRNLPIGGGGYFRLYPYWITARYLERLNRQGIPGVLYLQPWELDLEQPRMSITPTKAFRHYTNIETTEAKLHRLLGDFSLGSLAEVLQTPSLQKNLDEQVVYLKTLAPTSNHQEGFKRAFGG